MTLESRLFVYEFVLNEFLNDPHYRDCTGFCAGIYRASASKDYPPDISLSIYSYPELMEYAPANAEHGMHWWSIMHKSGYAKRVNILKAILKVNKVA